MNCPKCKEEMAFNFKSERGRHKKIHYKCPNCGKRAMKRDKLISNNPSKMLRIR